MRRNKTPYILRYIRYLFKCLWYYVLFPIGIEQDEFSKTYFKNNNSKKYCHQNTYPLDDHA